MCVAFIVSVVLCLSFASCVRSFQPALSHNCSHSLAILSQSLQPQSCGYILKGVLGSSANFTTCTSGRNGVNCFDFGSLYQFTDSAPDLIPVYHVANQSLCSLCTARNGMKTGCSTLLDTLVTVVYGGEIDYSSYNITNQQEISQINTEAEMSKRVCRSFNDRASMQILKYQSELLCESSNTFNMPLTESGTIDGVLDMRSVMQCGTCAVLPCFPGQYCDGKGSAVVCPEGYYCPNTAAKIACPKGYFCPEGSVEPEECRGVASGSCEEEGSAREVVWVPLFIALILLILIGSIEPLCDLLSSNKSTIFTRSSLPVITARVDDAAIEFSTRTSEVSITFQDVSIVTNKTVRLNRISGKIRPGKFTAIIGGSGAGKTTLMNAILGREAVTAGSIQYQSKDYPGGNIPARILDRIVAFVPQNDIYLRDMTVYELIEHSARWRGLKDMNKESIDARIEEVLTQLQLLHLQHIPVRAGLSPGDRKKVNIALELVSSPNVLFLDEPTTGIDASSALNIARIISNLAKTGLTCVAVIHQPRAEIFELIDDIIILSQGGRMAYQGNTRFVLPYFANLGYTISDDPKVNKTDFLIDITSKPPSDAASSLTSPYTNELVVNKEKQTFDIDVQTTLPQQDNDIQTSNEVGLETHMKFSWADIWARDEKGFNIRYSDASEEAQNASRRAEMSSRKLLIPLDRPRKGFFTQCFLNAIRGFRQHCKQSYYWKDLMTFLIGGIIMGIVSCGGPLYVPAIPFFYRASCPPGAELKCQSWLRFAVGPSTFYMSMILGALVIPGAVRTFGREKAIFARESAVGANRLAYFLGKIMSDVPFAVINTFIFLAPIVIIAPWRAPVHSLYGLLLCLHVAVSSMGYWLSILFEPDAAVLLGVILAILLNLFSGFVPRLGDGVIGLVMYTRWFARALCVIELQQGQGITDDDDFNTAVPMENWKDPNLENDCLSMLLIALILCSLTFVGIIYANRRVGKL